MTCYGFIGTGSMGSMLIRQFIRSGAITPDSVVAVSKSGHSAKSLAAVTGITVKEAVREVAKECDVLFICVRPLDVRGVLAEIHDVLSEKTLLISIAGCVTLADIASWSGPGPRCVKVMPSITAEEHAGISLVAWGRGVTPADRKQVLSLFSAIGIPEEIEERYFELFGDLTSCAPALFSAVLQEFAAAAVRREHIPAELAEHLVKQTLIGTARLLAREGTGFDNIISRVATRGGITEEGVAVLRKRLPVVYDELLEVTLAKHETVKQKIVEQERRT
jgi:pyrroline-5-carboxylate reductase